jgi:hypothetical protein
MDKNIEKEIREDFNRFMRLEAMRIGCLTDDVEEVILGGK